MQTVYLVEDSELVRQRLEAMLAGVPQARVVGHASSAAEAIEGILAEQPDMVLIDLNLERGTGFDVLRAVRAQAPQIDCYMLSNFAALPYRRHAADLGARDFFDKSTELECVRDVVARRAASPKPH